MKYHSNKNLKFVKDSLKSYVYVTDANESVGVFCWDYSKKRWRFDR